MMNPQHVPVNRPPFLNCHYPDDPLFLLCWPILNSMTTLFYFSQVLNDPPFYHFLLPNCPPFSSKSYYAMAHLFSLWHYLSMIDCFTCLSSMTPLFTTGYQMTPSLAGFLPQWPYFYCTWERNGLVFYSGCLLNDPIFLESTHFTW